MLSQAPTHLECSQPIASDISSHGPETACESPEEQVLENTFIDLECVDGFGYDSWF